MIKLVFLCLKNSLESRYLSFLNHSSWPKLSLKKTGEVKNVQNFMKIVNGVVNGLKNQ